MANNKSIQFLRGSSSNPELLTTQLLNGQPCYTTNYDSNEGNKLYIGHDNLRVDALQPIGYEDDIPYYNLTANVYAAREDTDIFEGALVDSGNYNNVTISLTGHGGNIAKSINFTQTRTYIGDCCLCTINASKYTDGTDYQTDDYITVTVNNLNGSAYKLVSIVAVPSRDTDGYASVMAVSQLNIREWSTEATVYIDDVGFGGVVIKGFQLLIFLKDTNKDENDKGLYRSTDAKSTESSNYWG